MLLTPANKAHRSPSADSRQPLTGFSTIITSQQSPTLSSRSIRGKSVFLVRNAYPRTHPRLYRLLTLDKLNEDAIRLCQLSGKPTKLFKTNGTVITSISDISDQETIYVSIGEPFFKAQSPLTRKQLKNHEILSFNRIIANSHYSIDETLKKSAASVFAALGITQQKGLQNVNQIHNDCQTQLLLMHLLRLGISPGNINILPESITYAQNTFYRVRLSEVHFVVGGPRQSGKTTLLYLLTYCLCRKLLVSNQTSQYIFFPLNCELSLLDFDDVHRLFRLFLKTTFEAVEYCVLKLLPYFESLKKWFYLTVFGCPAAFPAIGNLIESEPLIALARRLRTLLNEDKDSKSQSEDSLQVFIRAICAFPNDFARALGLKGAIFVIDAFDYTGVVIEPAVGAFPRSLKGSRVSDLLSEEIAKGPFIVAMKEEQLFFENFVVANAAYVSTEKSVRIECETEIQVRCEEAGIRLTIKECRGHPGFIARFYRIVEMVEAVEERAAMKSDYGVFKSTVDLSRMKAIKFELLQLIWMMGNAKIDGIDRLLWEKIKNARNLEVKSDSNF
jgi:hypothetical protein